MSEFYQNEPQLELRDREPNITVVPTCPYCKWQALLSAPTALQGSISP